MISDVMMTLGEYEFAVSTAAYQTLKRTTEYRWQSADRLGRAPAMQFVGAGSDEFILEGVIYPQFAGGFGQLDSMREMADTGTALLLTAGTGTVHGYYVIKRITEQTERYFVKGAPRYQKFGLTLTYYGQDVA